MEHHDALDLLRKAPLLRNAPQRWADLGCGTGTFTRALAELLPPDSSIIAMDRDATALDQVPERYASTRITKHPGDFINDAIPDTDLEGILLANALHFVRDQSAFIRRMGTYLKPTGAFLLVEYDMDTPNPWVPYPLSFATLERLFKEWGFRTVKRLAERPSVFRKALLYTAWVERNGGE